MSSVNRSRPGRRSRGHATSAVGHSRVRRDHATEMAEDYCEAVAATMDAHGTCRVRDLSQRFGVSHVTVIRTVSRLQREGLVETERYGPIQLSPQGQRLARRARERHAIVFDFLLALGVSRDTAELDAEGLEHHASPETLRCMKRFVRSEGKTNELRPAL